MAGYVQNRGGYRPQAGSASNSSSSSSSAAGAGKFKENPNEVGIVYVKESQKAGTYFSVKTTKDIPAGSKLNIFENRLKDESKRTEKTPSHKMVVARTTKSA